MEQREGVGRGSNGRTDIDSKVTKTRIHLVNTRALISILRELIQKQNGKRHRRHSSPRIPAELISAAKRRQPALEIFQNRGEKVPGERSGRLINIRSGM